MVSLVDANFLLKSLTGKSRKSRSRSETVMVMRTSHPVRRWQLKSQIDSKSSQPSFRWTKQKSS